MNVYIIALFAVTAVHANLDNLKPLHVNPPGLLSKFASLLKPNPRITNGEEVDPPHSLPYQVGLLIPIDNQTAFCGGSLLSPEIVLTAAHCAENAESIEVVLGAHRIREAEDTQVHVVATDITVHEEWNRLTLQNDLAIIRLPEPVELTDSIQPVKLPSRADASNDFLGDLATASGWGKDSDAATTISDVLRKVEVPVGSNEGCGIYYFGIITESHICTDGADGKSTCNGDSGGPLVSSDGVLIGATSFGISFGCEIGWPAVFTRITYHLDWISNTSGIPIE